MIIVMLLSVVIAVQQALDEVMLADDKLMVVLAVVLIIWAGFVAYVYILDRKLSRIERAISAAPDTPSHEPA